MAALFLPAEIAAQDHMVDDLIARMDRNKDGRIGYNEFVHFIKKAGNGDELYKFC